MGLTKGGQWMARMLSNKLTYLADYDDLSSLGSEEKIDWMHNRIRRVFIDPVKKFIGDNRNQDLALGVTTLICCAIEALGHFQKGSTDTSSSEKDFKGFIKKYITGAKPIQKPLYKYFRSGLAHAFSIERGSIDGRIKSLYIKKRRKRTFYYEINPWKLFEKLEDGTETYFNNLKDRRRWKLRENFIKRFNSTYEFWVENPPGRKLGGG